MKALLLLACLAFQSLPNAQAQDLDCFAPLRPSVIAGDVPNLDLMAGCREHVAAKPVVYLDLFEGARDVQPIVKVEDTRPLITGYLTPNCEYCSLAQIESAKMPEFRFKFTYDAPPKRIEVKGFPILAWENVDRLAWVTGWHGREHFRAQYKMTPEPIGLIGDNHPKRSITEKPTLFDFRPQWNGFRQTNPACPGGVCPVPK